MNVRVILILILAIGTAASGRADDPARDFIVTAEPIAAVVGGPVVVKVVLTWTGTSHLEIGPYVPLDEPVGRLEISAKGLAGRNEETFNSWSGLLTRGATVGPPVRFEPGETVSWILPLHRSFSFRESKPAELTFVWRLSAVDATTGPLGTQRSERSVAAPTVSLPLTPIARTGEAIAKVERQVCALIENDEPTQEEWDTAVCLVVSPGKDLMPAALDLMRAWSRWGCLGPGFGLEPSPREGVKSIGGLHGTDMLLRIQSEGRRSKPLTSDLVLLAEHHGGPWMRQVDLNLDVGTEPPLRDERIAALLRSVDYFVQVRAWEKYRLYLSRSATQSVLADIRALEGLAAVSEDVDTMEAGMPGAAEETVEAESDPRRAREVEVRVRALFSTPRRSADEVQALAAEILTLSPLDAGRWAYWLLEREHRLPPETSGRLRRWLARSFDGSPEQRAMFLRHVRDYGHRGYGFLFDQWRVRNVRLTDEEVGTLLKSPNLCVLCYTVNAFREQCPVVVFDSIQKLLAESRERLEERLKDLPPNLQY
jgi:hypothetical protein